MLLRPSGRYDFTNQESQLYFCEWCLHPTLWNKWKAELMLLVVLGMRNALDDLHLSRVITWMLVRSYSVGGQLLYQYCLIHLCVFRCKQQQEGRWILCLFKKKQEEVKYFVQNMYWSLLFVHIYVSQYNISKSS